MTYWDLALQGKVVAPCQVRVRASTVKLVGREDVGGTVLTEGGLVSFHINRPSPSCTACGAAAMRVGKPGRGPTIGFLRRRSRSCPHTAFPAYTPRWWQVYVSWLPYTHCKSKVFYRTSAPMIVYYCLYITCLLYLLFLIKHVWTSG